MIQSPNIALYTGGDPTSSSITSLFTAIQNASYTTAVLWAAHVHPNGDIQMNDDIVAQGGSIVSAAIPWTKLVTNLRKGTVNYIELSLGGDSPNPAKKQKSSFQNIKDLINKYGIGSSNPLYGNLQALQGALGLDAIDYDDENEYDLNSSVSLAQMCINLGMSISICPYDSGKLTYWVNLVNKINGIKSGAAVASYLQCYSGGGSNNPQTWNQAFAKTGIQMTAGLGVNSSMPAQVQSQLENWNSASALAGGFMFCGTQMTGSGQTPADYATAISNGMTAKQGRTARA
jgi:hypothetical protein